MLIGQNEIFFQYDDFTNDIFVYNEVFGMYLITKYSHIKSSMMPFASLQQITLDLDDFECRCTNGWTNLPQMQNPYLLKILTIFWKLQLVYMDFLQKNSMSLMSYLEFLFF